MGLGAFFGKVIGVAEGITGIDIPFVGPGDTFLTGQPGPGVPGGRGPLDVAGLPSMIVARDPGGCGFFTVWDPLQQKCVPGIGSRPGGDVMPKNGRPSNGRGAHAGDHVPFLETRTVRSCFPGSVLGKDGMCHERGDIPNAKRAYPKPRRVLGSVSELNAVATAKTYSKRLLAQHKTLKETARNLARAGGMKLG